MKNLIFLLLFIMALLFVASGCKKSKEDAEPDYTPLFKNTTWSGEFIETGGKLQQPYVISFKDDGTLTFLHGILIPETGTWKIEKKQLIIELPKVTLKTNITGERFTNIQCSDPNRLFRYLELNKVADQVLDGTIWQGLYDGVGGNPALHFFPGKKVLIDGGSYSGGITYTYSRTSAMFYYGYHYNGIYYFYYAAIMADNTIRGIRFIGLKEEITFTLKIIP
ncbi:hypothetical protein [Pedobacter frigoris]|uniref:Uncharacterized protein n=1 Tax=Pedobacter frigoris TaxID=2571272 RepID=A0A4U1CPP7_9SPHI|nr:hypothetical protein [Pedobacter frigoris]TKC07455.1 hypothetical protein FA047_09420 [Pedobacter frigoris]